MYKRILIPTDGSILAENAAQAGIILAKPLNASVIGFHAMPAYYDLIYKIDVNSPHGISEDVFNRLHERMADQYLNKIKEMAAIAGVQYDSYTLVNNSASAAIAQAAREKECDLICIGSHGRSGVAQTFLGSVTNKLLSICTIPILIHREPKNH